MSTFAPGVVIRRRRGEKGLPCRCVGKQRRGARLLLALVLTALRLPMAHAAPRGIAVTVHAAHRSYKNALVMVDVAAAGFPAGITAASLISTDRKERLACQVCREHGGVQLVFMLPELSQGETRTYRLSRHGTANPPSVNSPSFGVSVALRDGDMDLFIGSGRERRLFTTYTTHSGPNKPFFYPILTPEGAPMTRRWPLEQNTGESHDHIHHRGLWFTHSSVNGIDFWTEQGDKVGKTINTGFSDVESGPVCGEFRAATEWRTPDGKLIATDTRDVRLIPLSEGDRLLDFAITITPVGAPLTFGDNKDGTFGLRLPDSLASHPDSSAHIATPTGHTLNDSGQKDGDAWGKPANWVDYWGPIAGKTYGVAIFDAPANLRHPQTWHARDYGLFTVNPFGLHDFHLGDKGAGDLTVSADKTLTLHYAVLFHRGDVSDAGVANRYAAWADPPEVAVNVQ
jgi:hypothetical protein